jgi:adenylate cyclase class 2
MENIEIKAKLVDPQAVLKKVQRMAHSYLGLDHQIDTYFRTGKGRMKLRQSTLSGNYLILYLRPNQIGPRSSHYETINIQRAEEVKILLRNLLGIDIVVEKDRHIFLYENVRIHLDHIDGLGDYLEFEAVMDSRYNDHEQESKKVRQLMQRLQIQENMLIPASYQDLLRKQLRLKP